jgi:hypothetical protein
MGSRDAEAMSGRSEDDDAGGMVWGSMIGKKLFGGSGLAHRAWPRFRAVPPGRAVPVGPVDPVAHTSGEGSFRVQG